MVGNTEMDIDVHLGAIGLFLRIPLLHPYCHNDEKTESDRKTDQDAIAEALVEQRFWIRHNELTGRVRGIKVTFPP
jgi:hypothetical protein